MCTHQKWKMWIKTDISWLRNAGYGGGWISQSADLDSTPESCKGVFWVNFTLWLKILIIQHKIALTECFSFDLTSTDFCISLSHQNKVFTPCSTSSIFSPCRTIMTNNKYRSVGQLYSAEVFLALALALDSLSSNSLLTDRHTFLPDISIVFEPFTSPPLDISPSQFSFRL